MFFSVSDGLGSNVPSGAVGRIKTHSDKYKAQSGRQFSQDGSLMRVIAQVAEGFDEVSDQSSSEVASEAASEVANEVANEVASKLFKSHPAKGKGDSL